MSLLSDSEVRGLKEDVTEIKADVKEIHNSISDLKVLIAGNYVTKKEFEKHRQEEIVSRRWWAAFIVSAAGIVMALMNYLK